MVTWYGLPRAAGAAGGDGRGGEGELKICKKKWLALLKICKTPDEKPVGFVGDTVRGGWVRQPEEGMKSRSAWWAALSGVDG